jgi:NAD-dependent SIR2 family protein deacetylase
MSLVKLLEIGKLKFLVSSNTDGLHRKSGVRSENIAEIHGNMNLERCSKCAKEYMRDYKTRTAARATEHETGRKCLDKECKGNLTDSIINFGELLPTKELQQSLRHSEKADLNISLGSSLRVSTFPLDTTYNNGGKLVIIK